MDTKRGRKLQRAIRTRWNPEKPNRHVVQPCSISDYHFIKLKNSKAIPHSQCFRMQPLCIFRSYVTPQTIEINVFAIQLKLTNKSYRYYFETHHCTRTLSSTNGYVNLSSALVELAADTKTCCSR